MHLQHFRLIPLCSALLYRVHLILICSFVAIVSPWDINVVSDHHIIHMSHNISAALFSLASLFNEKVTSIFWSVISLFAGVILINQIMSDSSAEVGIGFLL